MSNRLREFQEVTQSVSAKAGPSSSSSVVKKQQQVDALRRLNKRRLARAKVSSQQGDNSSSSSTAAAATAFDVNDPDIDVWTLEAVRIASSVASLGLFLSSIRRAYLDLSSATGSTSSWASKGKGRGEAARGELDLSKGILEAWRDVKWLSDRERDEVDWQAKTTLKRCMGRIKQLEQAEANRHKRVMHDVSSLSANNISRLLGLPALQASEQLATEEQLHTHRHQIVVDLSRRLADAGRIQQEQQELRVARQLEKQELSRGSMHPVNGSSDGRHKRQPSTAGGGVPAAYVPAPLNSGAITGGGSAGYGNGNDYDDDDDDDGGPIDSILSQEQIHQFESESSALLQEANSQLAAIEKAQSSLLEISNLQSELAVHLTQQMEITDKLWEDSVLVSGRVEEGNKQLKQARDRNREGRLWLLIFLLGASFSLLFLEYY